MRAAAAVLVLARVATFMPMYPAKPEHTAPTKKETEIIHVEPSKLALVTPSITATATTKIAKTLYSRDKKAMAPSAIQPPIFLIRSLPASCLATQLAL